MQSVFQAFGQNRTVKNIGNALIFNAFALCFLPFYNTLTALCVS